MVAVRCPRLTRAEALHRAEQCVCGERAQDYGHA